MNSNIFRIVYKFDVFIKFKLLTKEFNVREISIIFQRNDYFRRLRHSKSHRATQISKLNHLFYKQVITLTKKFPEIKI